MKLSLKRSELIPGAWEMVVDLKLAPKAIEIHYPDYYSEFTDSMDKAFVYPFDCRRIGCWLRFPDRTKTYWCYVTLPEESNG